MSFDPPAPAPTREQSLIARARAAEAAPPPDPLSPHLLDLRRVLVLSEPPSKRIPAIPEAFFTPHEGRYLAGSFRVPTSRRIAIAVDPMLEPGAYQLEDALTGQVVRTGRVGDGSLR